MKRIVRFFCTDSPNGRRHFRDTMLNAIPVGKVLVLGRVWTGELAPLVDSYLEALNPIVSGFTLGRTLNAEPPTDLADMGRRWLGDLHTRIAASVDTATGPEPRVDVSEAITALERLREVMPGGNAAQIHDAWLGLRSAADRVSRSLRDASGHPAIRRDYRSGDGSKPRSIASISADNRAFWAGRGAAAAETRTRTASASDAVFRDAEHACQTATTPRARIAAMNVMNRLRTGEPMTADMQPQRSAPSSIADINARNRAFWSGR